MFNEKIEPFKSQLCDKRTSSRRTPKEISIALLEDKQLVELQSEGRSTLLLGGQHVFGTGKETDARPECLFRGRGFEKDAFLHYLDLGPQFNSLEKYLKQILSDKKKLNPITKATMLPDLEKDGTVSTTLQQGQEVVVQIVKEPISTKGPQTDFRTFLCRTIPRADSFQRQGFGITKN